MKKKLMYNVRIIILFIVCTFLIPLKVISAATPTITDIKFAPSMHEGLYISGDKISIIVSFSEPVTVDLTNSRNYLTRYHLFSNCLLFFRANLCSWLTDTPYLILETGVQDKFAKYVQGSGTKNLFFEYIVQDNDSSFIPINQKYHVQRLGLQSQRLGLFGKAIRKWVLDDNGNPLFSQTRDAVIISQKNIIKSVDGLQDADLTFHSDNDDDPWEDPLRTSNRILLDGKGPIHWKHHNITGDWAKVGTVKTGAAEQVFLIDLDQDDDIDILSANPGGCRINCGILWHQNMGDKSFISNYIFENISLRTVQASDMDNDGDIDIIAGGRTGILWFENVNNKDFIYHEILSSEDLEVSQVFPADIDADGDQDILAAIQWTNTLSWYENINDADHFIEHVISDNALGAHDIFAIDIDLDQDLDLATALWEENTVAWYENDNSQEFTKHQITSSALSTSSVYSIDLDQDGDIDILADSAVNDSITWYENDAEENFIAHNITKTADRAYDVFPIDLDSDGDIDVLSASAYDHKIAWYENDGKQNFVSHIITTQAVAASSVSAADLDNDGDIDVVSSSQFDSSVNWYENTTITIN